MFVTTNVIQKKSVFQDPGCAREAIETLYKIQDLYPFFLFGFVVMPDHCHFLLRVPDGGSISKIMNVYKRAVAFNIGKGPIWQSRFHLTIPKSKTPVMEYIHQNPVKAGLCLNAEDYPWSSASGKWDVYPVDQW